MANERCREKILSEEYLDFIIPDYRTGINGVSDACVQNLGFGYRGIHIEREYAGEISIDRSGYNGIPNCYALLDTGTMNETGISAVQNFPTLQLQGNGIMIGFVDTGIDYTNPVFLDEYGRTRVAAVWDQTDQTGQTPEGFDYGTEVLAKEIDEIIEQAGTSAGFGRRLPGVDTNGHGTFLASLAAGSADLLNQFQGAAPKAALGVVKLKPAKPFLKEFYAIREDAVCYQETDILQGLLYLHRLALWMEMPLVICIALGTNFGGHNGETILSKVLEHYARLENRCVVIGTGNEASQRHHYLGKLVKDETTEVELRVTEGETGGFAAEIWAALPNILTAYLVTPTGERSPEISIRQGDRYQFSFAFDDTIVDIEYRLLLNNDSSLLMFLRFLNPSSGIWKIGINALRIGDGRFHIWTSMREFLKNDVYFLEADPDITLTEPGSTKGAITVAYYNGRDNGVDINSGRGYTRSNQVKPDFAAPGVNVTGASLDGRFVKRSGSSISVGITGGAAALIMEWLKQQPESRSISTSQVANIMILGTEQDNYTEYPNKEWGYGTLDVYQSLNRLREL